MNIRFGSVCSGIEAASVAWNPLGWEAAWLSEVDPHASATLKHHYPDTPNYGDMSKLPERILSGEIEVPELFCGGTPCQAFSVAGLRKSLDDERGNLTLKFVEVANAIDTIRNGRNLEPCIIFWENVPGVLNTEDNAFGCFLAGIAGESVPLRPPGGRWENAGYVLGPQRAVAWRVLDAQYFGLAQRRDRVFVVASARDGFDPAAVLFESDGLRRDTPPSRETGQGTTSGVEIGPGGGRFTELSPTLDARCKDGFIRNQVGCGVAHSVMAKGGTGKHDPTSEILIAHPLLAKPNSSHDSSKETYVAHSLRGEGYDASEDGTGRGTPLVPVAFNGRMDPVHGDIPGAVDTDPFTQCVAIQDVRARDKAQNGRGWNDDGTSYTVDAAATQEVVTGVFFAGQGAKAGSIAYDENLAPTLKATDSGTNRTPTAHIGMQVRRLTPRECERLQGFPDDYTLIDSRQKKAKETDESAEKLVAYYHKTDRGCWLVKFKERRVIATADGPRYKCLGNSWAVPVVRWIGRRIEKQLGGHP